MQIRTLGEIGTHQSKMRPDSVALAFEGRLTTYAELERRARRVACGLAAAGVGLGDRIAYLGKNTDAYYEILLGALKIGAVMTPVNWRLSDQEIAYVLNDADALFLFAGLEYHARIEAMCKALCVRCVVALEGGGQLGYETWRNAQDDAPIASTVRPEHAALQLYTSGTTGHPKGVVLLHRQVLSMLATHTGAGMEWLNWSPASVSLLAMPCFHIGGVGVGLITLYSGGRGVIAREYDPEAVLDFIEREGISKLFLVPSALQFVVRLPRARQTDFSRLEHILYGASPIPLPLLQECLSVFRCGFVQMYGMTETCGGIAALRPDDHTDAAAPRLQSAGRPLPGVELAVVDAAGGRLPPLGTGEILVRSASTMAAYWHQAEATAEALDPQGWLHTGDAGYLDEEGYVYIRDRVKDMIISGGENIYPAEVESVLSAHPDVGEAAVIGVPDDTWGEQVKAIVVLKPGRMPAPQELIAWVRQRIAGYKAPRSIEFASALPRNPAGKILRRELRAPYWAGHSRQVN